MKLFLLAVPALTLCSAILCAQEEPPKGSGDQGKGEQQLRDLKHNARTVQPDAGDGSDIATKETSEGFRAGNAEPLSNLCSVRALLNPPRIAPGETGAITLVLALQGSAVILPAGPFKLKYEPKQGASQEIVLGAWQVKPPAIGTLEDKFRGQPIYDNNAQIEIPIAIAGGAAHGKYPVTLQVEVPLNDGKTGNGLGMYKTEARAEIVVGPSLPRPNVAALLNKAGARGTGSPPSATATSPSQKPTAPSNTTSSQDVSGGKLVQPKPVTDGKTGTGADDVEVAATTSFPVFPLAAGGGAILLLILVLALKRKS